MLKYQKYSGAGNTFLIADARNEKGYGSETVTELMRMPENSKFDGVIFLEQSIRADFRMNYFNKDGTGNALCGNGLRCTVRFIRDNNLSSSDRINLEAVNSIYNCVINEDTTIKVSFPPPVSINTHVVLKVHFASWWEDLECAYVDVGSPHIVVFIADIAKVKVNTLEDADVERWGNNIRMHKELMPEGANVNFVEVKGENEIEIRSYERGVEAETLACGTGAVSAAIVSFIKKGIKTPVNVLTRSGDMLTVAFNTDGGEISSLSLAGPAVRID